MKGFDEYGIGKLKAEIPPAVDNLAKQRGWSRATVSSGDSLDFSRSSRELFDANGASLKDMETHTVAHMAEMFNVNFLSLIAASNILGNDPGAE